MKYEDAMRGYAFRIHERDGFVCQYCGLDGKKSLSNWVHLSRDHLLPVGHPDRNDERFQVTACRFCNEADNRRIFEVDGKSPEELLAQKTPFVLARRTDYEKLWAEYVQQEG